MHHTINIMLQGNMIDGLTIAMLLQQSFGKVISRSKSNFKMLHFALKLLRFFQISMLIGTLVLPSHLVKQKT